MSPYANGMSRSFFCAKSSRAAPTKVTAYRWPVSPACLKKSSIARKKFLLTWKVPVALSQNQSGEEESRLRRCRNRKSRNWTCYKREPSRTGSNCHLARALTHASGFVISCAANYGRQNRKGTERTATRALAQGGDCH